LQKTGSPPSKPTTSNEEALSKAYLSARGPKEGGDISSRRAVLDLQHPRELLGRPDFPRRMLVTALALTAWQVLTYLTVPWLDLSALLRPANGQPPTRFLEPFAADQISRVSVAAVGLNPYVNALIILRAGRIISVTVRRLTEPTETFRRWVRWLAVPLALGQTYGLTVLWQSTQPPILPDQLSWFSRLAVILTVTAGTVLMVWLGEVIDEHGLGFGSGVMLLYVIEIAVKQGRRLAAVADLGGTGHDLTSYLPILLWIACALVLAALSVLVLGAVRRVPIEYQAPYSKGGRAQTRVSSSSLTLHPVMSGVLLPPTVAVSIIWLPLLLRGWLPPGDRVASWIVTNWSPVGPNPLLDAVYLASYVLTVIGVTRFVALLQVDGASIAARLEHQGARVPGVRPGKDTAVHLNRTISKLALVGGCFLALAGVIYPAIVAWATRIPPSEAAFDGFGLVLFVSVILWVIRGASHEAPADLRADLKI
jgi:preprotein translocase subunit SecY